MKKKSKIWIFITLGIVGFIAFGTIYYNIGPATIYFDNGFEESFIIYIDGEKKGEVAPLDFTIIKKVKNGEHKIEIKKGEEIFDSEEITAKGETYIYNIRGKYSYYIVVHEYSSGGAVFPRGGDERIGFKKFFTMPDVDYGLGEDIPKEVEVEATQPYEARTSLQRVSD